MEINRKFKTLLLICIVLALLVVGMVIGIIFEAYLCENEEYEYNLVGTYSTNYIDADDSSIKSLFFIITADNNYEVNVLGVIDNGKYEIIYQSDGVTYVVLHSTKMEEEIKIIINKEQVFFKNHLIEFEDYLILEKISDGSVRILPYSS